MSMLGPASKPFPNIQAFLKIKPVTWAAAAPWAPNSPLKLSAGNYARLRVPGFQRWSILCHLPDELWIDSLLVNTTSQVLQSSWVQLSFVPGDPNPRVICAVWGGLDCSLYPVHGEFNFFFKHLWFSIFIKVSPLGWAIKLIQQSHCPVVMFLYVRLEIDSLQMTFFNNELAANNGVICAHRGTEDQSC